MIAQGKLQGLLIMDTHGGRARAIMTVNLKSTFALLLHQQLTKMKCKWC